jgi:hypothetical protein
MDGGARADYRRAAAERFIRTIYQDAFQDFLRSEMYVMA